MSSETYQPAEVPVVIVAIYLILAAASVVAMTVFAVWLYYRYKFQPMRKRSPFLVLLFQVSLGMACFLACLQNAIGDRLNCVAYWILYCVFNIIALTCLVVKGAHLVIEHGSQEEAINMAEQTKDADESPLVKKAKSPKVYLTLRKHMKEITIAVAGISAFIFLIPFALYFGIANRESGTSPAYPEYVVRIKDAQCIPAVFPLLFMDVPIGFVLTFAILEVMRRVRGENENLRIKEELENLAKIFVAVGTIVVFLVLVQGIASRIDSDGVQDFVLVLFQSLYVLLRHVLLFGATFYFSGIKILRLTYEWDKLEEGRLEEERRELANIIPERPTLEWMRWELLALLQSDDGFNLFKAYLCKEFSVENLLFWSAVRDFRIRSCPFAVPKDEVFNFTPPEISDTGSVFMAASKDPDPVEHYSAAPDKRVVRAEAQEIYMTYCASSSVLWVNLPHSILETLRKIFQDDGGPGSASMFDGPRTIPNKVARSFSTRTLQALNFTAESGASGIKAPGEAASGAPSATTAETVPVISELEVKVDPELDDDTGISVSWDVFDLAGREILNLMCSDTFRRFRMKQEYRDFVWKKYKDMKKVAENFKVTSALVDEDD